MCGICPQQDILYDELTCFEHLELYSSIKGIQKDQIKNKVSFLYFFVEIRIPFCFYLNLNL